MISGIRWRVTSAMASALASLRCQGGADRHLPLDPGRPRVTDKGGRVDDGPPRVDSKHPAAVRMGVSGQPCNGDRVSCGVERAGEFAGVWDRLGEIIRTVEGAGEIDVTDLFNERRALVELDGIQLDGKGCKDVEAVAVGSTGEVRRRGADRTRLGNENRPCGSRREGRGAEHSKGCDAKCTDESSRGPHVHTSKHLSKQASVRPLLSPKLRDTGAQGAPPIPMLDRFREASHGGASLLFRRARTAVRTMPLPQLFWRAPSGRRCQACGRRLKGGSPRSCG